MWLVAPVCPCVLSRCVKHAFCVDEFRKIVHTALAFLPHDIVAACWPLFFAVAGRTASERRIREESVHVWFQYG